MVIFAPFAYGDQALDQSFLFEAEHASLSGVELMEDDGASGGVRVIRFDEVGDYIGFANQAVGSYLYITYSLGLTTPKQCSVYVNDVDAATAIFYPTGDWNTYKPLLIEVPITGYVRLQIDQDDQVFNNNESCASQDKIEIMDQLTPDLAGLATVGQRYRDQLMSSSTSSAGTYMRSILPDGTWASDIYPSNEVPYTHIARCSAMLRAYNKPGDLYYHSPEMLAAALLSFHRWMIEDWQDWNWYDNEIGATREAAYIMLVGRGQIPPHDWTKGLEIINRAWPPPDSDRGQGQNLVYRLNQTFIRGVIEDDPAVAHDAVQKLADEIIVPAKDAGIKVDWAFHQHGPQLYWGGYGVGFAKDISRFALKVAQTNYSINPAKLDIITNLLLDGMQWAIRGHALDPGVTGRSNSRPSFSTAGNGFASICDTLIQADCARQAEVMNMANNIRGKREGIPLSGNRHFFSSDFMAHHRLGYYTSFKMASNRVYGTESGSGEGVKNFHLPDGATWLFRRGDEYDDIYPVLDWKRLPGITCEQYIGEIPLCDWGNNSSSDSTWAGGASDGTYGAATFYLNRLNVSGYKAAFYFDDEFILLGAGISCDGSVKVLTTINQCLLNGTVTIHDGESASVFPPSNQTLNNLKWIHHDGVGYVLMEPKQILLRAAQQSGSRYDINNNYSTDIIRHNVFRACINHGVRPRSETYAYAVLPGIDANGVEDWANDPRISVLSNTPALQAVVHKDIKVAGAAFMEAGSVLVDENLMISVDQPCAVVIRYSGDRFVASVANPENQALTVHMTVSRKLLGEEVEWRASQNASILTFDLPGGHYAGKSVVKDLAVDTDYAAADYLMLY